MSQVSYGTITITDTNDIESITVEYNRNQSSSNAPSATDTNWSTTRPDWAQGYYIWQRTRVHKSGTTADKDVIGTAVCITGSTGQTGTSVTISSIKYAVSTTESQPTDSSFTYTSVPTVAEGSWLWTLVTYSNGSKAYTKSKQGVSGDSITVSKVEYQSGTSPTSAPTGTWQTSIPTVAEGNYLWTKTTYSDGNYTYSVAKQGKSGTSVSISSTSTTYQVSTSPTTTPTGEWQSTVQSTTTGQYLWTRTIVTYSDGNSTTSYSVAAHGATGTSISISSIKYAVSSTDSQPADSSFTYTSVPTVNEGQWLWTLTTYSNGSKMYTKSKQGKSGNDGQSLTATKTEYTIAANNVTINSSNHTSYTWTTNTPDYDASKPAYWGRITNTYANPAKTEYLFYKDEAITKAVADAAIANSIAQHANEDAQGAMSQSTAALQRVQAKYGTSSTAATTAAKVASCEGFQLFNGAEVFIKFTNKNNVANPTLNVNSTGAKSIRDSDGNALDSKFYWKDGSLVHFVYDGTYWRILDIVTTEKYNNLVSDINGISQTVGTKASQTDLTNLTTRVSTNETNISQTATSITSLVSNQDTYTAPDGTTKTNTIKSAIKQNADNISLRVEKNGVIAAINASTESSGGSAVKISADKVNIEGAAIFTSGRLSTTNLNTTIDGRIPEIPDDISDLTDTTGKIPTKVSDLSDSSNYAKTTDIPDVSGFAVKTDAVYRTQRIYRRYTSAQSNLSGPTTWVTANTNIYNNWTTKIPPLTSGNTIYAYLYTCVQKQTITQYNGGTGTTCTCTPVLLDDTTTVINGGSIIAGSITANEITGNTLSAIYADMGTLTAGKITKGNNTIDFDNGTLEFRNQSTWATATQGIKYDSTGLAIKGAITATSLTIASGASVSGVVVPSQIANMATQTDITNIDTAAQGYAANASYSVEIKVTSIDYSANTATLTAVPFYQGGAIPSGTTLTYTWYKDSVVSENIVGSNSNILNVTNTTDMGLDGTYICVISK